MLLHRLVDQTVVVELPDVGPLGFGMIDKFKRIRHGLLCRSERARESKLVEFKAAL